MKLDGQVALIIGGARGIGEAIARMFSQEGASLVLVDLERMKPELDGVAQAINQEGGKAVALTGDCSDNRQVNALVDETVKRFGKIDSLINSAGFRGPLVPVTEISEKEFDDVMLYNLKLVFLCCQAVLKQMVRQKSGSIVSISGTAGREGMAMRGSLCAAKWGVVGLTKALAAEMRADGRTGIRFTVLSPGSTDTPLWDSFDSSPDPRDMLQPEDVADAIVAVVSHPTRVAVDELMVMPAKGVLPFRR
jgi:3-oxoacyl-[acyl-carrier protein] reductase